MSIVRYRERNNYVTVPTPYRTRYHRLDGSWCVDEEGMGSLVNGTYSAITDAGSEWFDNRVTRYLEHHKSEIQSFYYDVWSSFNSYTCGPSTSYHMTGAGNPGYVVYGNPWILGGSHVQDAINEAFAYFASGCSPKDILLANFAWELPSVKGLWDTFQDWKTYVSSKPVKKKSTLDKLSANTFLGYDFGVVPLISDIMVMAERIRSLDEHIGWLIKNDGKPVKVVFRRTLDDSCVVGSTLPSMASGPSGNICVWREIEERKVHFNAWATMTYDVSALSELQLKARSLIRSFGLNNPAAILWEAMPYSFVVDWFLNVGDWLSQFEVPLTLPNKIIDCGYGVKVMSTFAEYFKSYTASAIMRRTKTVGYSRRQGLPIGISGLNLDVPGFRNLVQGLALFVQRT